MATGKTGLNITGLEGATTAAKNIFVYRNGDTHFQCKRVTVNPRHIKNWDAFIELVTANVKARNGGAVRRVFTPTGRTKLTDLSEIIHNKFYVAAGAEGFKRHEYNKISNVSPQKARLKLPPIIKPVQHSRLKVSARCKRAAGAVGSRVIYVFRNGDANSPAVKILFTKFMLKNYDVVLNEVTRKVNIMTGAVWKLHSLDGKQLQGPEEFEDFEFYVACGRESFKKVPYPKDGLIVSPRAVKPAQPRKRPTRLSKDSKASSQDSKTLKPSQTEQKSPPKQTKRPSPPKGKKKEKTPEQREAEEVFHSKPAMVKRSREREHRDSLEFGDDPEGIFKAKEERNETKNAAEVQETQDTAVDLPIDQVAAEEVEEEEILGAGQEEEEPSLEQVPQEPADQDDLNSDEVPEDIPDESAPPGKADDDGVAKDENGVGDDSGDAGAEKEEEEQPNAFLTDDLGEITNEDEDEPAGFYSKRSPVTSKTTPLMAAEEAPASPTGSNGRAQSPNENNNNNTDIQDAPLEDGVEEIKEEAGSPAKQESTPPSPANSSGRAQSPIEDNVDDGVNRDTPLQDGDAVAVGATMSPHPPSTKRSAPPSPTKSLRRTSTPKNIPTASPVNNPPAGDNGLAQSPVVKPENEGEQNNDSNVTPQPPPSENNAPASPVGSNGPAQEPTESNSPRPASEAAPPQNGEENNASPAPENNPSPPPNDVNEPGQSPPPSDVNEPAQSPVQDEVADPAIGTPPPEVTDPAIGTPPPESGGEQPAEPEGSPQPPPSEANAPASPAASNPPAQSPIDNNSPRPASGDVPPEIEEGQVSEPAGSPDLPIDNISGEEGAETENPIPAKEIENADNHDAQEGEIAA